MCHPRISPPCFSFLCSCALKSMEVHLQKDPGLQPSSSILINIKSIEFSRLYFNTSFWRTLLEQICSGGNFCGPTLKLHFKNPKKIYMRIKILANNFLIVFLQPKDGADDNVQNSSSNHQVKCLTAYLMLNENLLKCYVYRGSIVIRIDPANSTTASPGKI